MTWRQFESKTVKTRRSHQCEWCGEPIEIGSEASYWSGVEETERRISCYYLHLECVEPVEDACEYDGEFTPMENRRGLKYWEEVPHE